MNDENISMNDADLHLYTFLCADVRSIRQDSEMIYICVISNTLPSNTLRVLYKTLINYPVKNCKQHTDVNFLTNVSLHYCGMMNTLDTYVYLPNKTVERALVLMATMPLVSKNDTRAGRVQMGAPLSDLRPSGVTEDFIKMLQIVQCYVSLPSCGKVLYGHGVTYILSRDPSVILLVVGNQRQRSTHWIHTYDTYDVEKVKLQCETHACVK